MEMHNEHNREVIEGRDVNPPEEPGEEEARERGEQCVYCDTVMGSLIQLTNGWCCARCFKKIILQLQQPSGDGKGGDMANPGKSAVQGVSGPPACGDDRAAVASPEAPEGWDPDPCKNCHYNDPDITDEDCDNCGVKSIKQQAGAKLAAAKESEYREHELCGILRDKLAAAEKEKADIWPKWVHIRDGYLEQKKRIAELEAERGRCPVKGCFNNKDGLRTFEGCSFSCMKKNKPSGDGKGVQPSPAGSTVTKVGSEAKPSPEAPEGYTSQLPDGPLMSAKAWREQVLSSPGGDPVKAVYEKFKHLDHLLSDPGWMAPDTSAMRYTTYELWEAVKAHATRV
jgi:hypothetical protein